MSKTKLLLGGLKSFLPVGPSYSMASHSVDVRYGYSVWLRHLAVLARHGIRGPFHTVLELGPGNSVVTGVSAILSGAERYIGLDVLHHLSHEDTLPVLEEVATLFRDRAPIPGPETFGPLRPLLEQYEFPADALGARGLSATVEPERIAELRRDLEAMPANRERGRRVQYMVPWTIDSVPADAADLIVTQAVLQEIPHESAQSPLAETIAATARWMRPGAVASHQVDLGMYGLAPWNVHWTWSDLTWKLVRGRRDNFVNRVPLSTYVELFRLNGLEIVAIESVEERGVPDDALMAQFRSLPAQERRTRSAQIVVRKRA